MYLCRAALAHPSFKTRSRVKRASRAEPRTYITNTFAIPPVMSDREDSVEGGPPTIEPYEVLGLERTATADDVKKAYRKAALKHHPDKVADSERAKAHETFQSVAFAYAVLSDPARRKRYDTTGSTAESIVDSDGFNWSEFYREQFKDAISTDAIEKFASKYKGSDEEKDDVLVAYEQCAGDMDALFEHVILSSVVEDEERFRAIIDQAIKDEDVPAFKAYTKEPKLKPAARLKRARSEAAEAEDYAKELGVHDQIFGSKKGKKNDKAGSEDALAALIQQRQQNRSESFFDHLEAKYATPSKGKKGKKRAVEEEPSEEAFQAAAAKLKGGSKKRRK
ncbi:DnaJ subfamily C member 9 [Beauveria bassiana D1-5]|uniref:DnaJ subfamily C member 9 n=1 Tax=Beauveria bassiana D1-5 TaxID=1245745 RepID=A0A0A2VAA6_BEABA|nr:DnaJ subfamily C member 9 [Beauveria bassiana D1-5]